MTSRTSLATRLAGEGPTVTRQQADDAVTEHRAFTEHHVVFNSLDNETVNLYFGVWGDCKGTLQWKDWKIEGPLFGGWEVYHMKGSPVDPDRIYASQTSSWFGQVMQRSDDAGETWEVIGNEFCYDGVPGTHQWYDGTQHPWEFKRVWHLEPSLHDPDTVYAGVEDAALFKSTDAGQTWQELPGLRAVKGPLWQPGAGGMSREQIGLLFDDVERAAVAFGFGVIDRRFDERPAHREHRAGPERGDRGVGAPQGPVEGRSDLGDEAVPEPEGTTAFSDLPCFIPSFFCGDLSPMVASGGR